MGQNGKVGTMIEAMSASQPAKSEQQQQHERCVV